MEETTQKLIPFSDLIEQADESMIMEMDFETDHRAGAEIDSESDRVEAGLKLERKPINELSRSAKLLSKASANRFSANFDQISPR